MRINQRASACHLGGGRLQIEIGGRLGSEPVADFKSESMAGFKSELLADFPRNPQRLPALHGDINVLRIKLDEPRASTSPFGCDHRRAGTAEWIEDDVPAL